MAHVLDAAGDDDVVDTRGDLRGGEVEGLLAGAALAIHRRRGHLERQARLQPGIAPDVERLFAVLRNAADEHILDGAGSDAGAPHHLGERRAEQVVRMNAPEDALLRVPAPDRRAHGLDDHDLPATHSTRHLSLS